MLADRINVVEGFLGEAIRGRPGTWMAAFDVIGLVRAARRRKSLPAPARRRLARRFA